MRREGKRIRTRHLELRAIASLLRHGRVGIIVPKFTHSSVDRNRLKRRLREIVRCELLPALPALDVVIRARADAYGVSMAELRGQLGRARTELARMVPTG